MDELRATVESDEGRERAKQVIRRTAGTIVSIDDNGLKRAGRKG